MRQGRVLARVSRPTEVAKYQHHFYKETIIPLTFNVRLVEGSSGGVVNVEASPALLPLSLEEEPALAALLGRLGGDERGVVLEEAARIELGDAICKQDIDERDHTAAGDVGAHVLVVLVAL